MFTQNCLIRKNTKELINNLKELGYKMASKSYLEDRPSGILCRGKLVIGIPDDGVQYNLDKYLECNPYIIDCGTNEDLFLALAALRDDTDKNQWFVIDVEVYTDLPKGSFFKATPTKGKYHIGTKIDPMYCHKATVNELIEYFKNK